MADLPVDTENVSPSVSPGGSLPMPSNAGALSSVGEAEGNAGEVATRIHATAMQEFNQTSALDANNQRQSWVQSAVFDPEKGLLNQNLGKDAPGAVDKALADYDSQVNKISGTLTNDQQRLMFARSCFDHRMTLQQHLDAYETRQVNSYHQQVSEASAKNAAVSAVNDVNGIVISPDPMLQSAATRQEAMTNAAERNIDMGVAFIKDQFRHDYPTAPMNDPRLQGQVEQYESAAHYGVLQSLLGKGNDQDAKSYYDANKTALRGEQADHVAMQVESASVAGGSIRMAPSFVYDNEGKLRDRQDIYDRINGDTSLTANPRLYDATLKQANMLINQHEEARNENDRATFSKIYNGMQSDPQGLESPALQAKMATLPPQMQQELKSWEVKREKNQLPQDGNPLYYHTRMLAHSQDVNPDTGNTYADDFKHGDVMKFQTQLSPRDFHEVFDDWTAMQGAGGKGQALPKGILSSDAIVGQLLHDNGYKITGSIESPQNADTGKVLQNINNEITANGGYEKLGSTGVADIVNRQMSYTKVPATRSLFNPMRLVLGAQRIDNGQQVTENGPRVAETYPANFAFNAAQIPPDTRREIIGYLSSSGVSRPREDQIYKMYLNKVGMTGRTPNAGQ